MLLKLPKHRAPGWAGRCRGSRVEAARPAYFELPGWRPWRPWRRPGELPLGRYPCFLSPEALGTVQRSGEMVPAQRSLNWPMSPGDLEQHEIRKHNKTTNLHQSRTPTCCRRMECSGPERGLAHWSLDSAGPGPMGSVCSLKDREGGRAGGGRTEGRAGQGGPGPLGVS